MVENTINYYDIQKTITYLKEFYNFFEDMPIIKKWDKITSEKLNQKEIKNFSKYVIQFLFMNNLTILKSRSSNSIRHIFPPDIDNYDEFIEFFGVLIKLFKSIDIDIEIVGKDIDDLRKDFPERHLYFYFQNFGSIFKFLLYWDDSLGSFSKSKVKDLKELFKDFEIYIHFIEEYMNQIFGEKGIINGEKLTATKFFNNIFSLKSYKRHSIYKWRDECFFPATVLIDINKSKYRVKHIKIGKAQKINKSLLDQIKKNYEFKIERFLPQSESMLGYILSQEPSSIEKKPNFLADFKAYLSEIPTYTLNRYEKELKNIKDRLTIPNQLVSLKSLRMKNFKSYKDMQINFQNGINILYGVNGTGKTTILDAIFFALFMDDTWQRLYVNNLYDLELKFLNTHQIRVGEDYCEVKLELKRGQEEIKITRKLWKNGKHILFINDYNIFDSIKQNVINRFEADVIEIEDQKAFTIDFIGDKPSMLVKSIKNKFFVAGAINQIYIDIMKNHNIELGTIFGDFEELRANLEGSETQDDYDDNWFDLNEFLSVYFNIINEEIRAKYKGIGCLFTKNEIFASLFQEFSKVGNDLYSDSHDLHSFILDKFGVNFIEKNLVFEEENKLQKTKDKRIELISRIFDDPEVLALDDEMPTIYDLYEVDDNRESKIIKSFEEHFLDDRDGIDPKIVRKFKRYTEESKRIENKIKFLNETKDFLFFLFLEKINEKLIEISQEFFQKEKFYSFLDKKGVPKIMFYEKDEVLPISCLSGGERSKLILILLGLLINISNKNSFFLIDEPNELLDPDNIENMKLLFTRIFENRQIIICTFMESYKSFKPALIYQIEKLNNVSYITQIAPKEEINLKKLEIFMNRLCEIFEVHKGIALPTSNVVEILNLEEDLDRKWIKHVIDELLKEGTLYEPKSHTIKFTDWLSLQKKLKK